MWHINSSSRVYGLQAPVWCLLAALLLRLPAVAAEEEALLLVQNAVNEVLQRLEEKQEQLREDDLMLNQLVVDLIVPHFDFDSMSRFVLARHWRTASMEQRHDFSAGFQRLMINAYAGSLLDYTGQQVQFLSERPGPRSDLLMVRSEIVPNDGGPRISVDYRMRRIKDQWKIIDVKVDGVSLLATYRSSFDATVRDRGLDVLIAEFPPLESAKP